MAGQFCVFFTSVLPKNGRKWAELCRLPGSNYWPKIDFLFDLQFFATFFQCRFFFLVLYAPASSGPRCTSTRYSDSALGPLLVCRHLLKVLHDVRGSQRAVNLCPSGMGSLHSTLPQVSCHPPGQFFWFSIASLFVTCKLFSSSICLPCESWSLSFCLIPKKFLVSVLLPNNNVCSCAHLFGCGISDMQLADIHAAHFWRLGVRTGIGDMSECRNPRLTLTRFVWDVGYVRLAV